MYFRACTSEHAWSLTEHVLQSMHGRWLAFSTLKCRACMQRTSSLSRAVAWCVWSQERDPAFKGWIHIQSSGRVHVFSIFLSAGRNTLRIFLCCDLYVRDTDGKGARNTPGPFGKSAKEQKVLVRIASLRCISIARKHFAALHRAWVGCGVVGYLVPEPKENHGDEADDELHDARLVFLWWCLSVHIFKTWKLIHKRFLDIVVVDASAPVPMPAAHQWRRHAICNRGLDTVNVPRNRLKMWQIPGLIPWEARSAKPRITTRKVAGPSLRVTQDPEPLMIFRLKYMCCESESPNLIFYPKWRTSSAVYWLYSPLRERKDTTMDDDKILQYVLQYLHERGFSESVETLKKVQTLHTSGLWSSQQCPSFLTICTCRNLVLTWTRMCSPWAASCAPFWVSVRWKKLHSASW